MRKDIILNQLAEDFNVAQFVSYQPCSINIYEQTFSRVQGYSDNHVFNDIDDAISRLLAKSIDGSLNIRSFLPDDPRSKDFVYGLIEADIIKEHAIRLLKDGFFIILNETIDVNDGGVSGVIQNQIIEFAPNDTPRAVEKKGVLSIKRDWGERLIQIVYGIDFKKENLPAGRIEFSIHPQNCGFKSSQLLVWEHEDVTESKADYNLVWPNKFSQHVGDKLFGLMIAHILGFPVPYTQAFLRNVAPFSFGIVSDAKNYWLRTCPVEQQPGKFTTVNKWIDPFRLLAQEDPDGNQIASVIWQQGVKAKYSGAAIVGADGHPIIEGVSGAGDDFMLGKRLPEKLPQHIVADVLIACHEGKKILGDIRFEWAHDGRKLWIVQFHIGRSTSYASVVFEGAVETWVEFNPDDGLSALRELISRLNKDSGIKIMGSIGVTSHLADLLRKNKIPSVIK